MSKIYVDEIAGIASADTVAIPGHVIQVVNTTSTSSVTINADYPQTSGITASITPSSTSSKVVVMTTIQSSCSGSGANANKIGVYGIKNNTSGTTLGAKRVGANLSSSASDWFGETSLVYLDSPSSTSAQTYEILLGRLSSGFDNPVGVNLGGATGTNTTITLMEIAG